MKTKGWLGLLGVILILGVSMSAEAGLFGLGGMSWKEEVLLHDGKKIVVERSQNYGGRHEIGQSPPVKEHTIKFSIPGLSQIITWTSEYGEDLGRTNFNLLALHVLNGIPYLIVEPNLCFAFNKYGRPNPPYVIFKYEKNNWQRIALLDLPSEFKTINLIVNNGREEDVKGATKQYGYVIAKDVQEINSSLRQFYYHNIVREPLKNVGGSCGEMVPAGKEGWIGIGWFKRQVSYEVCLKYCEREEVTAQRCPCESLFGGKK